MAIMMRQNSVPWDSESEYGAWNPRSLSTFQTFRGGESGLIPNGVHHSHSRSLVAEDPPIKARATRVTSRSLGEAQEFLSLNNGTLLVREDGTMEVRIGLGPSDKRFGFSVVGGTEEGFRPRIDKITEGSPADRADLEVGDEILEVNGKSLENATHTEVISHIHQCIRSRTICLRVKRKSGNKIAADLANNSNVQDAFVIAVEQQARERLEKLSTLKQIEPVDMAKLSQQLSSESAPNLNTLTRGSQKSIKKPDTNGKENVSVISIGAETQTTISIGPTDELDGELFRKPSVVIPDRLQSSEVCVESSSDSVTVVTNDSEISSAHKRQKSEGTISISVGCEAIVPHPEEKHTTKSSNLEETKDIPEEPSLTKSSSVNTSNDNSTRPESKLDNTVINGNSSEVNSQFESDLNLSLGNPPELLSPIGSPSVWINEIKAKSEDLSTMEAPKRKTVKDTGKESPVPVRKEKKDEPPRPKPSRRKHETPTEPKPPAPTAIVPPERQPVVQPAASSPTLETTIHKRPPGLEDVVLGVPGGKRGRGSGTIQKGLKDSLVNGDGDGSRGASLRSSGTSSAHSSELDDTGSHREMAVDVPDNFISRTKTPPKWPTSKPTANGYKPTLPSRDHLRIEEDGRLINRAQPPQVPSKVAQLPQSIEMMEQPSKEQLDRIRKYQEDTKKRKELEEKLAREEEFLRSSLRGSRKLQLLENDPPKSLHGSTGFVNTAFDGEDEGRFSQPPSPVDSQTEKTAAPVVKDLTTALAHVQQHLKRNGYGMEADLATVHSLLTSPAFRNALGVHSRVQDSFCVHRPPSPMVESALDLVSECITCLQDSSQTEAAELVDILSRFEVEGLIFAHDRIAERMTLPPPSDNDVSVDLGGSSTPSVKGHMTVTPQPSHSPILLDDGIKIVRIEKTNEPLGATVRNDGESVVIGRIVRGGAAERCGQLHENDEVLEVNGVPLRGKSVNDVCDLLAGMTGTLTFVIQPANDTKPSSPTYHGVMHVKAHFDYDPEDDLYIPCRELGLSFQKGDVLHVISQEDPNWWQAHRDGEEEHNLAGLIPSKSFQQQREMMKQTIMADSVENKRSKKNTLLCARKMHKKKKKKVQYNSNFTDEFDAEEILTYEEVALYYPREYHKRPLVLIGPPNIGRQELRQRLMLDSERFAAAVPHTSRTKKDYEVDGQDYHFISRAQFEADIVQRRFVEHGEYERSYYGTSIDAIRAVINQGRICVLNLHPQSLKLLRTSDLMPYVVFIAPPSLEKLRQKKIAKGEPVKDDELKDIIEKAREMEEAYGHYFDLVIVNSDDERTYSQLLQEVNVLEREPQWVPALWLKDRPS